MWLLVACTFALQILAEQAADHRELIQFTPNTLTQARFFQLRRRPSEIDRAAAEGQRMREQPVLICHRGMIGLSINQKMAGRIYASHQEKVPECMQFVTKDSSARFSTPLDGICGVRTTRQMGFIEYRLRVVVSFSFEQLTEDDVIYDVTCRFNEANVSVDAQYDTKNFIAHAISNKTVLPKCQYSLHKDDVMGEKVTAAKVGQVVFHRWTCPSDEFAFKVYRCFVHNGMTKSYMIVDDRGCSLDEEIIPHPEYDLENHIVFTPAKAFRFSKSRRVHFNCLLAVCHKWDKKCMKSIPPRCPHTQKKRQLPGGLSIEERLLRVHALLNGLPSSQETEQGLPSSGDTLSLSTEDISIEDDDSMRAFPSCSLADISHWLYVLLFTNIISISVALFACSQMMRNRYAVDMYQMRKNMGSHFKF